MGTVDLEDVQGNILRGYRLGFVRHLVVRVADPAAAREFLGAVVSGDATYVPQITTAKHWGDRPTSTLNVGVTAAGMTAVGLGQSSIATFPEEFREGPVVRATKLGDVGRGAPENWRHGFANPDAVHLMWSVHAISSDALDEAAATLEAIWRRWGAFDVTSRLDGQRLPDGKVHFGYRDSISQPRFHVHDANAPGNELHDIGGETGELIGLIDRQPLSPIGAVLLGHATTFPGVRWQMPVPTALGTNGSFNAFRVLEQDAAGFERFLTESAERHGVDPEWIAAKLMGRWRNGAPLVLAPDKPELMPRPGTVDPTEQERAADFEARLNDFDYVTPDPAQYPDDFDGVSCPVGAHIRRANPRGARIVQRSANYTRRIVRRGIPYGPAFDPAHPTIEPRGLLGNFLCASLIAQFESIMYDWINKGLQDPRITGTNDPIIGVNDPRTSRFEIPGGTNGTIVLRGFDSFTHTVGSAYYFVPSVTAISLLSTASSLKASRPTR